MKEYKVVVLGSGGVGKSALTLRFVDEQFAEKYDPNIEDFYRKDIDIDGSPTVIEILDTACLSQPQFASMLSLYIKNGQGFLLVYSVIDQQSFMDVKYLKDHILSVKDVQNVPVLLVGNKCDLEAERAVSTNEGSMLSNDLGCPFFETSAKTKKNVEAIFVEIVREIIKVKSKKVNGGCCTLL